jgi:hypothetical protein
MKNKDKNICCQLLKDCPCNSVLLWFLGLPVVAMFYFSFRNFSKNALFPAYTWGAFFELFLPLLVAGCTFFLLYRLAKKLSASGPGNALWLAASFVFGSAYFFAASSGNFFGVMPYLIGVLAALFAFEEFFRRRRFWLVGLFVAMGGAFNPVILLVSLFFLLHIFFSKRSFPEKARRALFLAGPVIFVAMSLLWMNAGTPRATQDHGAFGAGTATYSIKYIPENIQKFILKGPIPVRENNISYVLKFPYAVSDGRGMSILFTAPVLFFALFAPWRKKAVKFLWATFVVMAVVVMMTPPGATTQIAYSPAIYLYPVLFVLAAMGLAKHINVRTKTVMVLGIILDLYWLVTFVNHI